MVPPCQMAAEKLSIFETYSYRGVLYLALASGGFVVVSLLPSTPLFVQVRHRTGCVAWLRLESSQPITHVTTLSGWAGSTGVVSRTRGVWRVLRRRLLSQRDRTRLE
jgi:hypothetical protein